MSTRTTRWRAIRREGVRQRNSERAGRPGDTACQTLLLELAKSTGLEAVREAGEWDEEEAMGHQGILVRGGEGGVAGVTASHPDAFDVTVTCTQRLTNGVNGLESATHGAGYSYQAGGEAERRGRGRMLGSWSWTCRRDCDDGSVP
jgi:hypothetical protein